MRVVWFGHNSDIGGAELCLADAVTALRDAGVDSHVFLPWRGELEAHLASLDVTVSLHRYRWWVGRDRDHAVGKRLKRAALNAAVMPSLLARLRALKPDAIVTNTLATATGAIAARALGIPHVWYVHELGAEDMGLEFDLGEELSGRMMNRLSTRLIAVSHAVREKFERWLPADHIDMVYNAVVVPPRPAVPLPSLDGPLRLVTVGMKHPGKRQEDAVRAVALLAREGVDVHLTLAGREDAEYGPYLRGLVRDLGVEDRVEVKHFVRDAFEEVENAHVFVMSSRNEAFGRVTIEAMKLGRPVIGSDRAGTTEFVRDGCNGLLYRAQDPADLAAKIRVLAGDRAKLVEMARNALEWSTPRFTVDRYRQEMYDSLRAAVAAGPAR